ncbi:RAMP superfamily CRISPR-associated protein [Streptomyces sp. NPDC049906]|uniref:RAMP superfamily CRISPR-associated protein n=1 Tax=Streptomyces sp. NPDC049906 TaxID=3155656 RepID=UPI00341264E0
MSTVHLLEAVLELTGPGAVAAPESLAVGSARRPSLPLARDGWGNPYVPATSLVGSLRQQAARDRRPVLFGEVVQGTGEDGGETLARASTVRVLGTRCRPEEEPAVRRRTAVDRHRAAARATSLHSRELLPPGTEITLWLRIDSAAPECPLVNEVVALLGAWRPRIGGGRTTGYGRAELVRVRHRAIDLSTTAGLLHWLTEGGPELVDDRASVVYDRSHRAGGAPDEALLFDRSLEFRIVDALHIGGGEPFAHPGRGTDAAPLLRDHEGTPVVPGSTWKGVLRARCEFILGSVGVGGVCTPHGGGDEHPGPGTCGRCAVCVAFGWTERSGAPPGRDGARPGAVGARGWLLFADSPIRDGRVRVRNHVALDRVFGGARDGALYAEQTVEDGHLVLAVRHDPPVREPGDSPVRELVRAALVLALSEVADGTVGIGGGTTRGHGTLAALPATSAWLAKARTAAVATLRRAHRDATAAPAPEGVPV